MSKTTRIEKKDEILLLATKDDHVPDHPGLPSKTIVIDRAGRTFRDGVEDGTIEERIDGTIKTEREIVETVDYLAPHLAKNGWSVTLIDPKTRKTRTVR